MLTNEARAALNDLDEVLSRGDETAKQVWSVISALRGPDSGRGSVKSRTTTVVRSVALPKTAKLARSQRNVVGDFDIHPDSRFQVYLGGPDINAEAGHFKSHIRQALVALGVRVSDGSVPQQAQPAAPAARRGCGGY